jgi:hypothetical protein
MPRRRLAADRRDGLVAARASRARGSEKEVVNVLCPHRIGAVRGNNREHPVLILTPSSEIDRNGRVAAADRSFNNWGAAKEKLDELSGVKD